MKKLILILSIILFIGCSDNTNKGYGYDVKTKTTSVDSTKQKMGDFWEKAITREESRTMKLYNLNGGVDGIIRAYKGEYDGCEFYIFSSGDGLSVIPVAMCKYYEEILNQ